MDIFAGGALFCPSQMLSRREMTDVAGMGVCVSMCVGRRGRLQATRLKITLRLLGFYPVGGKSCLFLQFCLQNI